MKISKYCLLIFIIGLFVSCSQFDSRIRLKPQLISANGLLISNSQTNPYALNMKDHELKIEYTITVKNISDKDKDIDLGSSYYQANEESGKLNCVFFKSRAEKQRLLAGKQTAILCEAFIRANEKNKLLLRDTDVNIFVTLESTVHKFTYRIYSEEFKK